MKRLSKFKSSRSKKITAKPRIAAMVGMVLHEFQNRLISLLAQLFECSGIRDVC